MFVHHMVALCVLSRFLAFLHLLEAHVASKNVENFKVSVLFHQFTINSVEWEGRECPYSSLRKSSDEHTSLGRSTLLVMDT